MSDDSKVSTVRDLDRINLRLSAETFAEIDSCRDARPGAVSRNTWITEAIEEKLGRDLSQALSQDSSRRRHA